MATIEGMVSDTLRPGVTTTVNLAVVNPSSHDLQVGKIVLARIEVDPGHPGCRASTTGSGANFAMPPVEVDRSFPPGRSAVAATGGLTMIETGVGQDACRGATLTLILEAT